MTPNPTLNGQECFAAFVAHELRTPIAVQRALVESALADPDADTAALRAMGEDVLGCCEQQRRLIEALLDLSRSRRGLRRHEAVDVAAVTNEALRAHDVGELESTVAFEPARTTGDPELIKRLADNLVSNATRHNVAGGRIEVTTRTDAHHAVLAVANTGPPVPDVELTRLFRPFERLGTHTRGGGGGVGLGLAIVQAIADAHKAIITAHARETGGLSIVVAFPSVLRTGLR
jgi:signal transduction histidine kinase